MSKKNVTMLNGEVLDNEPEIFGRPRSREEIKAEQKALRAQEVAALREARRQAKISKVQRGSRKGDLLVMGMILVLVVAFGTMWIGSTIAQDAKEELYQPSKTNTAAYYNPEAKPTLEDDGISVAINEIYYTEGGYLAVGMTLGNGSGYEMTLDELQVALYNADEQLIGRGYTNAVDASYRIPANGYNNYTLYILPELVMIANDSLEHLSFEAQAVGTQVEE